jgi:N-acyl-D-aspartate/D-glutamate deacylase
MAFDLVIRGASVADGTGAAATTADIGIAGGVIRDIGRIAAPGAREIDADGAIVTPGFIDVHTHYDGQVSWDGEMLPSAAHGVTTAIMGNCGVGFAPCRKQDRDRLVDLMEGVEDIPGTALHEGIRWGWETIPEYLDAVAAMPRTVDVGVQVPHNAVRLFVMGERALRREAATAEDMAAMARIVVDGIAAGAVGFTTANTIGHRDAKGNPTYARHVAAEELYAIGEAMGAAGRGVIQLFNDFYRENLDDFPEVLELARRSKRPLSFTLEQDDWWPEGFWQGLLKACASVNAAGFEMRAQVAPRPLGSIQTLAGTIHPFVTRPTYMAMAHLPLAERVARLRDPAVRAQLLAEPDTPLSQFVMSVTPRAEEWGADAVAMLKRMFPLGDDVDYEPVPERSIWALAQAQGRDPQDVLLDQLLENDGHGLIYVPIMNYGGGDFSAIHAMLSDPNAMMGLSDGGAHVGFSSDGSFPTYLLSHWARDRTRGPRIPLERAVALQTGIPARHFGLDDRGVVAVGRRADLNIIDFAALGLEKPEIHADLPAGGIRFLQGARGYIETLLAGETVSAGGALTGARPGRLIRKTRG